MNTLSARDNFHKTHNEKQRSDLSALVNSTEVKTVMIYAVAQMVDFGYSKEALAGAVAFRQLMLNIAEPVAVASDFKPMTMDPVPTPDGR